MKLRNELERAIYAAAWVAEHNRAAASMSMSTMAPDRICAISSTSALSAAEGAIRDYRDVLKRRRKGLL